MRRIYLDRYRFRSIPRADCLADVCDRVYVCGTFSVMRKLNYDTMYYISRRNPIELPLFPAYSIVQCVYTYNTPTTRYTNFDTRDKQHWQLQLSCIFGHLFVSLFLGIFNLQFIVEITSVRIKSQVKTDCDTLKVFASFMKFSHFKVISRFLQYCVTSVADLCFIKKDIIARWIRAGRVSPLINAERTSSHFTRYSATIIVLAICTRF